MSWLLPHNLNNTITRNNNNSKRKCSSFSLFFLSIFLAGFHCSECAQISICRLVSEWNIWYLHIILVWSTWARAGDYFLGLRIWLLFGIAAAFLSTIVFSALLWQFVSFNNSFVKLEMSVIVLRGMMAENDVGVTWRGGNRIEDVERCR